LCISLNMGWGDFFNGVKNFTKSLPVVGHTIAAVQAATGDLEGAKDTAIKATATTITVAATAAGSFAGPGGAVLAGAAGNVLAGQLENKMRGKDLDLDLKKVGVDATLGAVGGLAGGAVGQAAVNAVGAAIRPNNNNSPNPQVGQPSNPPEVKK